MSSNLMHRCTCGSTASFEKAVCVECGSPLATATEVFNFRTKVTDGVVFLRAEDVAGFIRLLADTEETDVRRRLHTAADRIPTRKF